MTRLYAYAVGVLLLAALAGGGVWKWQDTLRKAHAFDNVTGGMLVLEQSAEIGREASEHAGAIVQELNHEVAEDHRIAAAARRPGATDVDRERLRWRAEEAYAAGVLAACRLQRADCGPAAAAPAGD